MTRLKSEWMPGIEDEIQAYNRQLKELTGLSLTELAALTCGVDPEETERRIRGYRVAAIPITSGEGVIGHFSDSVAAILRTMGADVLTTEAADVDGMYEAAQRGADIFFLADDSRFLAMNRKTGAVADNNESTAAGFIAALEQLCGSVNGKDVLVVGQGIIGRTAAALMKGKGAEVSVFDKNADRMKDAEERGVYPLESGNEINRFRYIFDATNEGNWLTTADLPEDVYITAPGVPLSLTEAAQKRLDGRFVHDMLQIGTAVMLAKVV